MNWADKCYIIVKRSANVNLTQLHQNNLPIGFSPQDLLCAGLCPK